VIPERQNHLSPQLNDRVSQTHTHTHAIKHKNPFNTTQSRAVTASIAEHAHPVFNQELPNLNLTNEHISRM